ncbi:unnamed protein product, partial [Lampetra fluviatilis]
AFLHGYVMDNGAPEQLLTDQGRNLSSNLLLEVCDSLGPQRLTPAEPSTPVAWEGLRADEPSPSTTPREGPRPLGHLCDDPALPNVPDPLVVGDPSRGLLAPTACFVPLIGPLPVMTSRVPRSSHGVADATSRAAGPA